MKSNFPKGFYKTILTRFALRFIAWAIVPIALMQSRTIAKQAIAEKLPYGAGLLIQRYRLPDWADYLEMPDDYNFPAYEPTMLKIYDRCGWFFATWVNLSFRNVGQSLAWEYAVPVSGYDYAITDSERVEKGIFKTVKKIWPLKVIYGYSSYRNWKKEIGGEFVAIPSISIRFIWQD